MSIFINFILLNYLLKHLDVLPETIKYYTIYRK